MTQTDGAAAHGRTTSPTPLLLRYYRYKELTKDALESTVREYKRMCEGFVEPEPEEPPPPPPPKGEGGAKAAGGTKKKKKGKAKKKKEEEAAAAE